MEKIYTSPCKSYLLRNGYLQLSNLLLDYQQELGLSEGELLFIIRIMKNRMSSVIHDEELDNTVSTRTLSRRRITLKEKGYLNYSIVKKQDDDGTFKTQGVMYDLSPLEDALQSISDRIEENKEKELKENLKTNKIIHDTDIYLEKYKKDYKEFYGIDYNLNSYEIKQYELLNDDDKKIISFVFEYCKKMNLLEKIVPRLSLFFKTKFRFNELKKYCINCGYVKDNKFKENYKDLTAKKIETNELLIKEFKEKYKCNETDYGLLRVIERTCYRTTDKNIIAKIIDKYLEEV